MTEEHISPTPFQCQVYPSHQSNGRELYTPCIPDFYFDSTNLVWLRGSGVGVTTSMRTYIFPAQPLAESNCSSTVVGVEFCHQTASAYVSRGLSKHSGNILTFSQEGLQFKVTHAFNLTSTPSNRMCTPFPGSDTRVMCCVQMRLSSEDQFPISPRRALGMTSTGESRLLTVRAPALFEHFTVNSDNSSLWPLGSKVSFEDSDRQNGSNLPLLRFIIGMSISGFNDLYFNLSLF